MNELFLSHNIQWHNSQQFSELDPYLYKLTQYPYQYSSILLEQLPINVPGIITLIGGGQTGKTTLLKQWIIKLLSKEIAAKSITYLPGELIKDHDDLTQLLREQLSDIPPNEMRYFLLDNVEQIPKWDKAIKYAANAGWLNHAAVVLTSADRATSKKIQTLFPETKKNDFHLYTLAFRETVLLKHPNKQISEIDLFDEFNQYLFHGGYLPAINDMTVHGQILDSTLKNYSDWLKKAILQQGKQENFLREMLTAIVNHYNSQITWNMLSQELSINHPKTIGDYAALLEMFDAVFIQSALLENELKGAPKKARKLMFTDPFIFHSIRAWLHPVENIFKTQILPIFDNDELDSKLVKSCVTTHYRRHYSTYYIKAEGEIDLAYVHAQRFWPIVVSWTNLLRAKDLKQILKYPNGKILTKMQRSGIIEHIRTEPLPQALWRLEKKV